MKQEDQFTIGATVTADDGVCGKLGRVVLDPITEVLTHLVVIPRHRHGPPRLVSLDLVDATIDGLRLRGSVADFSRLAAAEQTHFAEAPAGRTDYERALAWPGVGGGAIITTSTARMVTTEHLPVGEVDIRRGDHVHAIDGEIGRVEGLVMTRSDRHVTHVLLQEGHLFGRKEVSIPVSAVSNVSDGVQLSLTKVQVRDLPPVDHDRPDA